MRAGDQAIWNERIKRAALQVLWQGTILAAIAACAPGHVWAQYSIGWFTIDGGGGMAAMGGPYTLGGTIGQPDAGVVAGGIYALRGGFWFAPNGVVGVGGDDRETSGPPLSFQLHAASPNPLIRRSIIEFDLPRAGFARVLLYDAAGRLTRTLADGPFPAGRHQRVWDGTDNGGQPVGAGIYFVRFDAERIQLRQKIVVLR